MNEPGRTRHDEAVRQMDQAIAEMQQKEEDPRVPGFPDGAHGDLPHRGEGETGARVQASIKPYYEDEAVTLYLGDCRDVLPTLDAVDHVITDPPYSEWVHAKVRRGGSVHAPDRADGGPLRPVISSSAVLGFEAMTPVLRRVCADHFGRLARRWVLVFSDVESHRDWKDDLTHEGGLEYVRCGAWVKLGATPQFTGDRPASAFEAVTISHPFGRKRWNGGGSHALWQHAVVNGSGRVHTTQKPDALMRELLTLFTDPGETVLDPFAGSGTTGFAAKRLGRRAILIEREEKYCEVAAKRFSQGALDLFGQSEPEMPQSNYARRLIVAGDGA
jgi:hypothetical protein